MNKKRGRESAGSVGADRSELGNNKGAEREAQNAEGSQRKFKEFGRIFSSDRRHLYPI